MKMKCDDCIRKYKCRLSYKNTYNAQYRCKTYQKLKIYSRHPFNTKKYARNPRERGYMLLKRKFDGTIVALADQSFAVSWERSYGILWHDYMNAEHYLHECKKWKDHDPNDEVFIVRAHVKACPLEIDFKHAAPRASHGNVLFRMKDNTEKYYKQIIRTAPV